MAKTSKANWNKLNKIQYDAIRVAIGCMKSTPTNVLLSETGELSASREYLSTKFTIKWMSIENSRIVKTLRILCPL